MDFQSLTRRELQALCKKNKIPANMTNVSMADALKALDNVEGIGEFSLSDESQSAQSSIESPEKSEVTSPYVPPTGGRTTRQRNVAKEEPQTLQPMTRSRYRTRQTLAKDAEESRDDVIETPAMAAQPTRRRAPLASACRKMEAQLKECAEEDETKDIRMTPARLQVTSRRRKGTKEESEVKRVYSTRRSVRLAEKNLEILNEVKNETSDILEKDLFMKEENEKVEKTVTESSNIADEVSDITGVDSKSAVEENSQKMDDSEISSGFIQDISIENKKKQENYVEEEMSLDFEADNPKPQVNKGTDAETDQLSIGFETGLELDVERSIENKEEQENYVEEEMKLHFEAYNPTTEVKQGTDAENDQLSIGFETGLELDVERADETEARNGENVVMPLIQRNEVQDSDGSPVFAPSEIEIAVENEEELKFAKDAGSEDTVADGIENVYLKADARCDVVEEENEINLINGVEYEVHEGGQEESVGNILCSEIGNLKLEEIKKDADEVPSSDALQNVLACIKNSPFKQHMGLDSASIYSSYSSPLHLNDDFDKETETCGIEAEPSIQIPPSFAGMDPNLTAQMKKSASKAASMSVKKSADDVSDNKENIGSGSKSVHFTKERIKTIKDTSENVNSNLNDLSMRKLSKMLKEKLEITNENVAKAPTRPALQVLPENRMVDETQN